MAEQVLCIDGGGSKTAVARCNHRGKISLLEQGPGCNPQDNPNWQANLRQAIRGASNGVVHTVVGMPGYGEIAEIDAKVERLAHEELGPDVTLLNDVDLACIAAFPKGDGLLLLAGTGSMAMVRSGNNRWRVGGWGEQIGDEGSAYWIGRKSLVHLANVSDRRVVATRLSKHLATHLGLGQGQLDLLAWLNRQEHPRSAIAALAEQVDALALDGSETARNLLVSAAIELADQARSAWQNAGMETPLRWAHGGSVFKSSVVLQAVEEQLGTPPQEGAFHTLAGGLWLAAIAARWPTTNARENALKQLFSKDAK